MKENSTAPYLEASWDLYSDKLKREIINELKNKKANTLETVKSENGEGIYLVTYCTSAGIEVYRQRIDLKAANQDFRIANPLSSLKTEDQIKEYFATYRHLKPQSHPDLLRHLIGLSSSAIKCLMIYVDNLLGKNYALINVQLLSELLGKNVYRKAKSELMSRDLLRKVDTNLRRGIDLWQINPLIGYKGVGLTKDYKPAFDWSVSKIPKPICKLS